ncbi:hypothetical protein BGZ99_006594 [Dissophora globulifera]|uniref:Uncharacterized protein n=1 Tax=Dissophora globulifera TaxID=979702 RepID=A0A9P6UZG9_9FUNG|nr:hypothetical protein BGZ99_006594 [Dissophora globulifera]
MPPLELQQEVLPIRLPIQPLALSRRRTSRAIARSDAAALAATAGISSSSSNSGDTIDPVELKKARKKPATDGSSLSSTTTTSLPRATIPTTTTGQGVEFDTMSSPSATSTAESAFTSPLTWLSRLITKAGQDERLHYHPNGQHQHSLNGRYQPLHHHSHHHHHHHHHHSNSSAPLAKQLFSKATVVTLEPKYATVHWAAEFYCTISSPCFALPLLLYLDPRFQWAAPEIHTTHFMILISVITAMTSMLYHATLYKIFSSLDACFATIMFYLNTIQLIRSFPDPAYSMMVPGPISAIVHWEWTPYVLTVAMMSLFIVSWKRTAMLSLLLMVMMIPATIWGFVVHECWYGLVFGCVGLAMFAADRFKFFCGHSYWHLAGGLSLWYGLACGALAK